MPKCIVIADDLTGANATGVLLKKNGFDTLTLLRESMEKAAALPACDCLITPTDSRAIPAQEAYRRVADALTLLKSREVCHYAKRIDSTLRGNLGSETDAFLDVLGPAYMAVCVPCFPSSGRMIIGGHLLVNGVPLRKTEAARDPKCSIHISNAVELFRSQSRYRTQAVYLDAVHDGPEALGRTIRALRDAGVRNLVVDSVTLEDMETVVQALLLEGIPVVSVDPGPFTAILAKHLLPAAQAESDAKILCAIGSVNGVAGNQTRRLLKTLPVEAEYMDIAAVLEGGAAREAEIRRLSQALLCRREAGNILAVIGCGIDPEKRVPFEPYLEKTGLDAEALSERINTAFAEVTMAVVLADARFKGIYSTGGDITAAIHRAAGTVGLRLLAEVVPLAGYGIAMGGRLEGRAFISKGGMVGDENAMVTCVSYLQEHIV